MEGDIIEIILSLARRDVYNGVGRVLIGELEAYGFTRDQVTAAIKALKSKYKVMVVGDVIKIYFGGNM
ncbi:hypothetical protein IG193_06780 [Infirmifilum lucidum]|uniref:Uncharacterized protein n=1 Tax=Infirmifilum lucidum TaxID=2776706 RepID=A0A7L9FI74_9CREN|nr:hypothetical protein [Infirmifilum lucidum]QOJ78455.1 hypothetical protein IG193_06780 [Infirmifilum lucidum]